MRKYTFVKYLPFLILLGVVGCSKNTDNGTNATITPPSKNEGPKYKGAWSVDSISNGLILYQFSQYYQPQAANQVVNVLKLDLNNPSYKLKFVAIKNGLDSLSSVASNYDAVAGINGTFGRTYSFVKVENQVVYPLTTPGGLHWWSNEGAFFYNGQKDLKIAYGSKDDYLLSSYHNIFSGGPILIDNYNPVGETFIGDVSGIDIDTLDYSDYRRIMGQRNPRTVIALTADNQLLLVTIDGRFAESAGMTAKEATEFLIKYFNPQYAINMDGGGSTTMYVKGKGPNGIVNYPCDNKIHNHYGQRLLYSFILITKAD
ncbi:MAG: phosphodiester glycosidase family protein [Thermoflavifilum aggregans]|nr:phosphodiester glycosidase family protein [Thermoflavifilum aggregans]